MERTALPPTAVFIDYESWFWGLYNRYQDRPDIRSTINEILEMGQLRQVYVFADFTRAEICNEKTRLRSITNQLIDCSVNGPAKDYTDFIMLGCIYQTLINQPEIDQYILITSDGHFHSVIAYLTNFQRKTVGVYGVQGITNRQLVDTATWYREIKPQRDEVVEEATPTDAEPPAPNDPPVPLPTPSIANERDDIMMKAIAQLYWAEQRGIVPKFMSTSQYCANYYQEDANKFMEVYNQLIGKGYVLQQQKVIDGRELRVMVPQWDRLIADGLWTSAPPQTRRAED